MITRTMPKTNNCPSKINENYKPRETDTSLTAPWDKISKITNDQEAQSDTIYYYAV